MVSEALGRAATTLPGKRRIYVVLDNAAIHKAKAVQGDLDPLDGRIELWFLPAFCPEEDPVGREWQAYQAAVTVLEQHTSLGELLMRTRDYFARRSRCYVRRHRGQSWVWKPTLPNYTTAHVRCVACVKRRSGP